MYYRLFLEGRIWLKTLLLLLPPNHKDLKSRAIASFRELLKAKALWGLVFALVFTSATLAVAYRCTPCSQNYYCQAGVSYECPPETPVTVSTGASSVNECVTCAQRDGGSYPLYDDVSGQCIACWQVPATTTPYWNGTACAACPDDTQWNNNSLSCIKLAEGISTQPCGTEENCLYRITENNNGSITTLDIVEIVSESTVAHENMNSYCQNKNARALTGNDFGIIQKAIYGNEYTFESLTTDIDEAHIGAVVFDFSPGLSIADSTFNNWLTSICKEDSCVLIWDTNKTFWSEYSPLFDNDMGCYFLSSDDYRYRHTFCVK